MTKLNQEILNMMNSSKGHLTAEEAFLMAKEQNISVSMASIYRILSSLADKGLLKKISLPNHADIFDKTTQDHEHLICKECGKITDIKINNFKKILFEDTGIKDINDYYLCINYICDDCKNHKH